ncbi:class I fructose-bisphosphate aldolase [Amylibacter marinus]|uniref:fructose-bisphosphate aldolase n=1 Tax=Amylibacter marinus TaxID=1475483 RepID=A0ABQ5VSE3_9RHOB|nr:fructose bisphosphate aldolase [Amylibacter marinus]GLQ34069.1 class I fructose-bisphosphate aldolase [Amylibacter marinus]
MPNQAQTDQMTNAKGFIAALDQSGGSTPKALNLYGIDSSSYSTEEEMFDLIHGMRARIAQSPAFNGDDVIAAILFDLTMDRKIQGKPSATYLWEERGIVPFLKVDKGLEETTQDVQMMKPISDLSKTIARAKDAGIFGTKMRSVIHAANKDGIAAIVKQQFDVGAEISAEDLIPILEPEITISISDKAEAETILCAEILTHLNQLPDGQRIMLKLSPPTVDNTYLPLIEHPNVMRVVALSGGYERDEANSILSRNKGMIASFSRALSQGLSADQSDEQFNQVLSNSIKSIAAASAR